MNISRLFVSILIATFALTGCKTEKEEVDWIELFNGKDFSGWEANETSESFIVTDGMIVANGARSHLFYVGDGDKPVNFKNFELSMDVMTHNLANSGLYFHTAHQKEGWLEQGYEVQINATHRGEGGYKEVKKGGSLYGIRNLYKVYAPDSSWYNLNVKVIGQRIQVKMNDQVVVDYIEPARPRRQSRKQVLSSGTFALQGHDPASTVFFKNIKVKVLPDTEGANQNIPQEDVFPKVLDYQANHFAFIDYHVLATPPFDIDSAMRSFYNTGINLGVVIDASKVEGGKIDESVLDHINKYVRYPVFIGVYRPNLYTLDSVSSTTSSQIDYVVGDITSFRNAKGEEINVSGNTAVANKNAFMNDYVKAITVGLDQGDLNILASATLLPEALMTEYDKLWTPDRMSKVIDALKRNNTAIEINNKLRIPNLTFLKLAKEKGCLFAPARMYAKGKMAEPDYIYEVIEHCKLDYKDIFIPHSRN